MFNHIDLNLKTYNRVEIDGKRHYQTPNGNFPSITTILSTMSDHSWLDDWKETIGEDNANRITRVSARRGTDLHLMCEEYLKNIPLSCKRPDAKEMFISIRHILNNIDNIHAQEASLYSSRLKVAGSVDCIAEYEGILSIIDFKNARRQKSEEQIFNYFLQECFYGLAFMEMTGIQIHQLVTIIAVEDDKPQVVIKQIKHYIEPLVKIVKQYYKEQK